MEFRSPSTHVTLADYARARKPESRRNATGAGPHSNLDSVLVTELNQQFERLRVQIQRDLRVELQELRKDMRLRSEDQDDQSKSGRKSMNSGSTASPHTKKSNHTVSIVSPREEALASNGSTEESPSRSLSATSNGNGDKPEEQEQEPNGCPTAIAPATDSPARPQSFPPAHPSRPFFRGGQLRDLDSATEPEQLGAAIDGSSMTASEVSENIEVTGPPDEQHNQHNSRLSTALQMEIEQAMSLGQDQGPGSDTPPAWWCQEGNAAVPHDTFMSSERAPIVQASKSEARHDIDLAVTKMMTKNFVQTDSVESFAELPRCQRLAEMLPIFHPKGYFNKAWCPAIYVAVLLVVTFAPFEVAFYWWEPPLYYKIITVVFDIVFITDMLVHFNTAFFHRGQLVTERKEIAMHYAKSYLMLDCIANFPFDWFLGGGSSTSRKFTKLVKLPKVLRFFRLLGAFKDRIEYIGVTAATGLIFLLGHYATCFWSISLAGDCEINNSCPAVAETYVQSFRICMAGYLNSDTFASHFVPANDGHDANLAVASLRDVGEPLRIYEDIFAIVVNLVGLIVVAFMFANIAAAFRLRSEISTVRKKLLDRRKEELGLVDAPHALSKKVLASYTYIWGDGGAGLTDSRDGLLRDSALSLWLRREIAYHVYGHALRCVPIFSSIPERFLKCLCQRVEVNHYCPGDYVVIFGEVGKELYIITEGLARPLSQYGKWLGHLSIEPGNFFGEISFLNPGTRRSASVVCLQFTRALVVTLETFTELNLDSTLESMREAALSYAADRTTGRKANRETTEHPMEATGERW